ncbi:MAG: tRNA (N6-threonylcarbamoyladenosine(37)-N6)-methyltransferase TrmO [Anaerohalosphaeraceae bacterium]|nr:tRNA (N6-threonylcarbamoyladenosine(37)-N6)-methyltransferase TrmO [Anaerohalosphaeraceae bacterium]
MMSDKITMSPVGIAHSPYRQVKDMPIQGKFKPDTKAWIELKEEYSAGLKDLDGFSHAIMIYYFHKSEKAEIQGKPFLEDDRHGIFAIRSPHRPNHIGLSIIKIEKIEDNKLHFSEVDVLNETPVLDIKPYIRHFDVRDNTVSGWVEKHFQNTDTPDKTILK